MRKAKTILGANIRFFTSPYPDWTILQIYNLIKNEEISAF